MTSVGTSDGAFPRLASLARLPTEMCVHLAARYKDSDSTTIAKLLMEAGAQMDNANVMGLTPFMCAKQSDNVELQQLLIAKGVDGRSFDQYMKHVTDAFKSLKIQPKETSLSD